MIFIVCTPPPSVVIFLFSLCVICTIWPPGTDPISMFSLTSLLPASFCTLLSDLLVLTHCLYDFDYCLTPIKILILTTLCIWVLSSLPFTPQFLTLSPLIWGIYINIVSYLPLSTWELELCQWLLRKPWQGREIKKSQRHRPNKRQFAKVNRLEHHQNEREPWWAH